MPPTGLGSAVALLIRPTPVPGEDWASYLRVAAQANGFPDAPQLAYATGNRLAKLRGMSVAAQATALGIRIDEVERDPRRPRGTPLWSLHERVCTECLWEGLRRFPSNWNQPLTISCREHGVFLIDTCPACQQPLNRFRPAAMLCDCGHDLRRVLPEAADDAAFSLGWQFLERSVLEESGTFEPPIQSAIRLAERMGKVSRILGHPTIRGSFGAWVVDLRLALNWLQDWPAKFAEAAEAYVAPYPTRSARAEAWSRLAGIQPSPFRDAAKPVLKKLHRDLAQQSYALEAGRVSAAKAMNLSMVALYFRIRDAQRAAGGKFSLEESIDYLERHASAGRMEQVSLLRARFGGTNTFWTRLRNSGLIDPFIPHFGRSNSAHVQGVVEFLQLLRQLKVRRPRETRETMSYVTYSVGNVKMPWVGFERKLKSIKDGEVPLFIKAGTRGRRFDDFEVDRRLARDWKRSVAKRLSRSSGSDAND